MNPIIATVDTQISSYSSIGTINVLDDATIDLTILTNGIVNAPWIEPEFQLIGVKADKNEVRQLDGFNVTSLENRTLAIKLKNEMLTYPGMLKLQLITKDSGRTSTTVFYLYVGQSLEHDIVSHRDVKVLDDLEAYVDKANHNLEVYEQRMDIRDEQFNNLNDLMNQAEAKRDQAELTRQQIFDVNEASRTRTFNNQMNNQETSFNDVQIERTNEFERDQTKRADDFVQAQNNREQAFNESQSANQSTFNSNEKKRQDEFNANQAANQKIFNDSESARARTFEAAESERCANEKTRKEDESKRVSDEVKRVEAENKRQQKMQEFEDIANQIASDLQEQVARVDEFVTANELRLLEEDARIDYMGNQQKSVRKVNEANVDYAVKTAIGEFNYLDYEGQHTTATNSIEGHARSAILKGQTLVNLCSGYTNHGYSSDTGTMTYNNGYRSYMTDMVQPNKTYTIMIENLGNRLAVAQANNYSETDNFLTNGTLKPQVNNPTNAKTIFTVTTLSDAQYLFIYTYNDGSGVDSNVVILEGDYTNVDIPYFEGMNSVRMPVLTTTGKNLLDISTLKNIRTDYDYTVGNYKCKKIKVEPNTTYTISAKASENVGALFFNNVSAIATGANYLDFRKNTVISKTYTTDDEGYLYVGTSLTDDAIIESILDRDIQIEQGTIATSYEPYKSNILSTSEEVVLRGIGDVRDELDLVTGEVTERIDEVVLDGSERWSEWRVSETSYGFALRDYKIDFKPRTIPICDILPSINYVDAQSQTVDKGIALYTAGSESSYSFFIRLPKTECTGLEDFKTKIQQNPITVQYQLATEPIKTVDLSDNVVYSYNGTTHYSCSSEEGSLVPTLSVKVPTDVQATIAQQRNTIVALEAENEALKDGLIEANQYREDGDMDLLSNQWDIDFRLFEIEMALDVPMMATFKLKEADIMSRYLQAKTLILGGRYERSKMEYQLKRYLEAGQLTQEEYDELISLMDAREMLE